MIVLLVLFAVGFCVGCVAGGASIRSPHRLPPATPSEIRRADARGRLELPPMQRNTTIPRMEDNDDVE